jgi:hypothetical protein
MTTPSNQPLSAKRVQQAVQFMLGLAQYMQNGMNGLEDCPLAKYFPSFPLHSRRFDNENGYWDSLPMLISGSYPGKRPRWHLKDGELRPVKRKEYAELQELYTQRKEVKRPVPTFDENDLVHKMFEAGRKECPPTRKTPDGKFEYITESRFMAAYYDFKIGSTGRYEVGHWLGPLCARRVEGHFASSGPMIPHITSFAIS